MSPPSAGYMRNGHWIDPPDPRVTHSQPPEIGRIHGPRGELLRIVRAPKRPVGFQPGRWPS